MDNELTLQSREFLAILVKASDNSRLMRSMALTMSTGVIPKEHLRGDVATLYRHLNFYVEWLDEMQRKLLPKCEINAVDASDTLQ